MQRLRFLLALPFLAAAAAAQPPGAAPRDEFAVDLSYSSREALAIGGVDRGEAAITHFGASYTARHVLNPQTVLSYGLAYRTHQIDADAGLPLPESLNELSLTFGVRHVLSAQWSILASLRPGFYGDFEEIDGDSLNAPLLVLANYAASPDLVWSFGLNANPFSDNPVLPVLGVRWAFAEGWRFNLAFPQSGFAWSPQENLTLRAGVSFQGGSFRITDNLGVPAVGVARLANTYVDYREVRAGLGLDWNLTPAASLTLDVGAVTDRKFDFIDRDFRLDGGSGFYGALAFQASF